MKQLALVLHQHESGYLSLLDRLEGRIDLRAESVGKKYAQPIRGACIAYVPGTPRGKPIAQAIEIVAMPFKVAKLDILFYHHILELVYEFLPLGALGTDVFYLVTLLYTVSDMVKTAHAKKLFLIRLFDLLGLHPHSEQFHGPEFHTIVARPIDTLLQENIDLKMQEYIHAWLDDCIKTHPMIDSLKTVHFLDDVRT